MTANDGVPSGGGVGELGRADLDHANPTLSLSGAQTRVDDWISQFEDGYWPPLVNLARLMEEVGELARLVNHRFGSKPKKPEEAEQELAEELADVLFVILCMANEQGIDLDVAFERVLAKYRTRDGGRWVPEEGPQVAGPVMEGVTR